MEEENPDANFGSEGGDKALQSDHLPMVESYLRFTVSGVSGQVVGATLRLHTSTYSGAVSTNGPAVYPAGNDWSEDGITWNDKPARTSGAPADDLAAIDGNDWASFDVSSLVNGDGVYTFDLASTSSDGAFFWSREAADGVRPELVLTLTGSSTPSPTSTATPPENTPTPTPPSGSQALAFAPQADARVEANNPDDNFGSDDGDEALQTDGKPDIETYLRFAVSGVNDSVQQATLRLHTTNHGNSGSGNGPAVYPTGNQWDEGSVTWNDRPARTSAASADDLGNIPRDDWASFDVTSLVTGNGVYTFNLATSSSDGADFWSREASDASVRPELVLTLGSGPAV
ncbi:MAG TPA: DNRLRE domain-containing protein, partial [Thermomicrobiales bacterium]|nr:DNRLRE domain-containing protein [Thermomicrobiales bacterium]